MPWLIARRWAHASINSDDPQKEVWFRLSVHESEYAVRANLRRYYDEEGIPYDEALIPEIASYFVRSLKQAREYFQASQSVSLMTRPLLLFYGMVCFSKLLILTKNPDYQRQISSDKGLQQHGLGYQDNRSTGHLVDNDVIRMQSNGTFSELYRCFKKELPARTEYSISELYQWIPDLYAHYLGPNVKHELASINTQIVHEGNRIVPKIEVKNRSMVGDETLFARYPFLKEDFAENQQGIFVGSNEQSTRAFPSVPPDYPRAELSAKVDHLVDEIEAYLAHRTDFDYLTREYLVPQEKEFELSPMLASYMLIYGYSRMCRYLPQKWGIALDGNESNEKWLIEIVVELVTKTFPLGIHSIFVGKPVTISTI